MSNCDTTVDLPVTPVRLLCCAISQSFARLRFWAAQHKLIVSALAGRSEMHRLLAQNRPAEAYFCGDDVLSIGALSAISSYGLSVPEDVGLIGLNDMEISGWDNIALTTIHQPIRQIVFSSIDLIVATLENPKRKPEARLFPCHVVERSTLRPLEITPPQNHS